MQTIEQIDEQIQALYEEKRLLVEQTLNETIYGMFSSMDKKDILAKIQEMMEKNAVLKEEVRKFLIDGTVDNISLTI